MHEIEKLTIPNLYAILYYQTTVLAVLDTMIQPHEGKPGAHTVYYDILDGDQNGHPPNCDNFDSSEKSCLYKIAKNNNKVTVGNCYTNFSLLQEVVYHDVVRLLLRRKWKKYGRVRFLYVSYILKPIIICFHCRTQFIFYIIHTAIMTSAFVLAAEKANPRDYDEGVDIFRGICEALFILCIMYNVCVELYQCIR